MAERITPEDIAKAEQPAIAVCPRCQGRYKPLSEADVVCPVCKSWEPTLALYSELMRLPMNQERMRTERQRKSTTHSKRKN